MERSYALIATFGTSVAFAGDSSPSDGGMRHNNDNLFNGWSGDVPPGDMPLIRLCT